MLAIKATHTAELAATKEEADAKIQYLRNQLERTEREKDALWNELSRKAKIIDRLIELLENSAGK
jgi:hypothetical protein